MKKTLLFLALALCAFSAHAQVTQPVGPIIADSTKKHGLGPDSSAGFKKLRVRDSITLGTTPDVKIYRNGPNMLRTPDSVMVDGCVKFGPDAGAICRGGPGFTTITSDVMNISGAVQLLGQLGFFGSEAVSQCLVTTGTPPNPVTQALARKLYDQSLQDCLDNSGYSLIGIAP